MRLQIASRLAVFALLDLAADPKRQLSVAQIGDKYGVSGHHLAKVMHILSRAGLVRAVRGAGGGYLFRGNARRTTLLDVVALFENMGSRGTHVPGPAAEEQALAEVLAEVDDIVRATLGSITIATMLKIADRKGKPSHTAADH